MRAASLLTRATAAIDKGVIRIMESRHRRTAPKVTGRVLDASAARADLIELAADYNTGNLGTPSPVFPVPALPAPAGTSVGGSGRGPLGTTILDLAFVSEYEPFHPDARVAHAGARENATVHARWWTSGTGRPTITIIHGLGCGHHWVTARAFVVPYWLRHGYDVAAFVLPHHAARAAAGAPLRWPSASPLVTNEGFGQAIHDLRALSLYLRSRGASAVGAFGMSLGGYTTALWASIAGPSDPGGIDFAVAMIPAVSMARLMWHHGESGPMRKRAAAAGITEDLLVDAFAVHAPTTRPPRLTRDRLAIVAGRGDRITPADQAEALAAHWGVDISWFDGGHLAQVGRADAFRAVRRQLGALPLTGREPRR